MTGNIKSNYFTHHISKDKNYSHKNFNLKKKSNF